MQPVSPGILDLASLGPTLAAGLSNLAQIGVVKS